MLKNIKMKPKEKVQYCCAVFSLISAAVFGAAGMWLNAEHVPAGGTLLLISQFLTFAATVFGIDYKLNK